MQLLHAHGLPAAVSSTLEVMVGRTHQRLSTLSDPFPRSPGVVQGAAQCPLAKRPTNCSERSLLVSFARIRAHHHTSVSNYPHCKQPSLNYMNPVILQCTDRLITVHYLRSNGIDHRPHRHIRSTHPALGIAHGLLDKAATRTEYEHEQPP